jgi:Holliday junction DNA helicase RuvA
MIGSLRGTLLDRGTDGEVHVEVAGTGIGYRAVMGPSAAMTLGELGDEVFLWISHHIRDDAQTLYGFTDRAERTAFEALLGAHGVGPALALAILSVHRPDELRRVLIEDDLAALCLVPGGGKKTAARLLIELKSRLDGGDIGSDTVAAGAGAGSGGSGHAVADVRLALGELGYRPDEITEVLRDLAIGSGDDPGDALRRALQRLGAAR